MTGEPISAELRRFLLASRIGVPHVEAILLIRRSRGVRWNAARLAARIYVAPKAAEEILTDLGGVGLLDAPDAEGQTYAPAAPELAAVIDDLDATYSRHLIEVTRLIHSARDQSAAGFAAAFRLRKES